MQIILFKCSSCHSEFKRYQLNSVCPECGSKNSSEKMLSVPDVYEVKVTKGASCLSSRS